MNPYMQFIEAGRKFVCALCGAATPTPPVRPHAKAARLTPYLKITTAIPRLMPHCKTPPDALS
jgi:hypothetical protein